MSLFLLDTTQIARFLRVPDQLSVIREAGGAGLEGQGPIHPGVSMDLKDLVRALLRWDALSARQWLADARRSGLAWTDVPAPVGLDATELATAAGVAEMLAERTGQSPPSWTAIVPSAPAKFFLVRFAKTMPRLRTLCEQEGPEPLRRRGLLAPPEFLRIA